MSAESSPKSQKPLLFRWRDALKRYGPESSTTRAILLWLSTFGDSKGGSCYPSQQTLAEASEFSERTVGKHLRLAEEQGWIKCEQQGSGREWKRTHYQLTIPPEVTDDVRHERSSGQEADSGPRMGDVPNQIRDDRPDGPEPHSKGHEPDARGSEPDDTVVPNEVPPTTQVPPRGSPNPPPTSDGTDSTSVNDAERLAQLATEYLQLGGEPRHADRKRIAEWLRSGRTPEDIEAAIIGVRMAAEDQHPELKGLAGPGDTMSTNVLEISDRTGPAMWQVATAYYHRNIEPSPEGQKLIRDLTSQATHSSSEPSEASKRDSESDLGAPSKPEKNNQHEGQRGTQDHPAGQSRGERPTREDTYLEIWEEDREGPQTDTAV